MPAVVAIILNFCSLAFAQSVPNLPGADLLAEETRLQQLIVVAQRDKEHAEQELEQTKAALVKAQSIGDVEAEMIAEKAVAVATEAVRRAGENEARNKAALCRLKAQAEGLYPNLKQQVLDDQQTIRNFGLEEPRDKIEGWGKLGQQALDSCRRKARGVFVNVAADRAVEELKAGVAASPLMSREFSKRLTALFKAEGLPEDDAAYAIARWVGKIISPQQADPARAAGLAKTCGQ